MLATRSTTRRIEPQEVHTILCNSRRRNVIRELKVRLEPMTLRELAERIAELETGESPPPRNARESVYNALHQTHLPKLDQTGVVEYDEDRKTVELQERAREVEDYMNVFTRYGITWAEYYRTLGVFALCAIVAANAGVPVLEHLPTLLLASGFLVVFLFSTVYQLWSQRWYYVRALLSGPS